MSAASRELLTRAFAAVRRSAVWWGIGIVALGLLTVAFWPSLEDSDALANLEDMSEGLLDALGASNIATPAGYLDGQMYALMLPLLLSGLAIANVSALTSGDEAAGRLEFLHALPVSRRSIWLSRFAAAIAALAAVSIAVAVVMSLSLAPFSLDEVSVSRIVTATAACALLAAFHGSVAYLLGGLGAARGRAVGVAVLVLVAGYAVNFLFPLADSLSGARKASPWYWAIGDQPVTDGVNPGWLLLLLAVTVALVWLGTNAVERRDIQTA